jgi:uncharacterized oxidoreductase
VITLKLEDNTVLITGGATGIGLALAQSFLNIGSEVIICGRREEKLYEAKENNPKIHIKKCDLTNKNGRLSLFKWINKNFEDINILVNNAGIQRTIDFNEGVKSLEGENEIEINLEAPIHLSALFIPLLKSKKESAIVNVSSGLAITPLATFPIYCATKAGVHTFTQCLRNQLSKTNIKVFEVLPPIVVSELNLEYRKKIGTENSGIKADKCAEAIMKGLANDEFEIVNPAMKKLETATREDLNNIFKSMNSR